MKNRKKKSQDIVSYVLIVVILLLLIAAGIPLLKQMADSAAIREQTDALKSSRGDLARLQQINEDVCGWITLDDTNIDFPIVQGSDNMEYLNKDVYGDSAIQGAIFLDARNSSDFSDAYSVVYGHHLSDGNMFSKLEKFEEKKYFKAHRTGTLYTLKGKHKLRIIACLVANSQDSYIYYPELWRKDNVEQLSSYIDKIAVHKRGKTGKHILALSTCRRSNDETRTVVICRIRR